MIATLGWDGANELLSTAATSNEVAAANQESTSGDSNLVGDGGNDGNEYASMGGVGVGIGASDDNNDVAGGNEGVGENDMEGQIVTGNDAGRVSVASVVTGPGNTTVVANVDPRLVAYFASLQQYGMVRGVDEDKQMVTLKIPELFRRIKFINDDSQLDEGGVIAKVLLHDMRIPVEICGVWWDKMHEHVRKNLMNIAPIVEPRLSMQLLVRIVMSVAVYMTLSSVIKEFLTLFVVVTLAFSHENE